MINNKGTRSHTARAIDAITFDLTASASASYRWEEFEIDYMNNLETFISVLINNYTADCTNNLEERRMIAQEIDRAAISKVIGHIQLIRAIMRDAR